MKVTHTISLIFHLVGLILGFGGAVVTDIIFLKCVRNSRAGRTLLLVMKTASSLVIIGYLMLVVSGIGLLVSGSTITNKFWAKMLIVLVIGANGTVAHMIIFPRLSKKIQRRDNTISISFLHQLSVVAAVSGVSWIAALILGAWKTTSWPIIVWVVVYSLALTSAISVSLLVTPIALRVDHPEFDETFPILVARSNRANMVFTPQGRARQRELTGGIGVESPPISKEEM